MTATTREVYEYTNFKLFLESITVVQAVANNQFSDDAFLPHRTSQKQKQSEVQIKSHIIKFN